MKRRILAALAGLSLFTLMAMPAYALMEGGGQYAFIADDEVVEDDLFIAAEEVVIDGVINGDVFAAATKVTVNGVINGDLYAAAGVVDVSGTVAQDIIALGSTVSLDGATVGDGVITAGEMVSMDARTTIGGGVIYAASDMNMNADVERGLIGASANSSIGGSVEKDVLLATGDVSLTGTVNGNMKAYVDSEVELDEQNVGGVLEVVEGERKPEQTAENREATKTFAEITGQLVSYLSALLVGSLLITFLPKLYARVGKETLEQPVMAFVWGLVFLVGVPFACLLLLVTVIGAPLSLIALAKYFTLLYMGKIFAASVYTAWLIKSTDATWIKKGNEYVVFAVMLLLFFVLKNLPLVGQALQVISLIIGWGAFTLAANEMFKVLKKAKF
jgi:hypothetical protein